MKKKRDEAYNAVLEIKNKREEVKQPKTKPRVNLLFWIPPLQALKWPYFSNQLSVCNEPKNRFNNRQ